MAIKTLQDEAKEVERVKFLQEAAIMGQFRHPNVITLHGVVTVGEPVNKAINRSLFAALTILCVLKSGYDGDRAHEKWRPQTVPTLTQACVCVALLCVDLLLMHILHLLFNICLMYFHELNSCVVLEKCCHQKKSTYYLISVGKFLQE